MAVVDDEKRRSWLAGIARLRQATIEQRLHAAAEQRRVALEFLRGGLKARFPHLTHEEIESRVGEIVFGRAMWQDICERRRRSGVGPRAS